MTNKEKLNQRFVKDFNLPINIFDDEMFKYYRETYKDIWPEEEYKSLSSEIINKYDCEIEPWLNHYAEVRDNIITDLYESEEFQKFNNGPMDFYDKGIREYLNGYELGDRKLYTEETCGKHFLSIDLRKANFQALKYVDVIKNADTYDEFIALYDDSPYLAKSKYTRQVIFGKLNPKRTTTVEKWMVARIFDWFYTSSFYGTILSKNRGIVVPFAIKSDELVFSVPGSDDGITDVSLLELEGKIKDTLGYDVRCEYYEVEKLPIVNCNDVPVDAYVRRNLISGDETLKSVSAIFFPQVYKLYRGEEITDKDLLFYAEGQTAKFVEPLRFKK